jgi:leucyl/phenylalanyl-tRNA--protein transferase
MPVEQEKQGLGDGSVDRLAAWSGTGHAGRECTDSTSKPISQGAEVPVTGVNIWPDPWDSVRLGAGIGVPVAIGGELTPEAIAGAQRRAIFCQAHSDVLQVAECESLYAPEVAVGDIPVLPSSGNPYRLLWWSPSVRYVIPAGALRLGRSVRRSIRVNNWVTTVNRDFDGVMAGCRTDREPRWITDEFIEALRALFHVGRVHTVEVWEDSELVGGVFGCSAGHVLIMESAFHRRSDAAKIAIADLVVRSCDAGYNLLDTEIRSDYTIRMGAVPISRDDYLPYVTDDARPFSLAAESRETGYLLERVRELQERNII